MSNITEIEKLEMFDTVVHEPTGFVFKFFQLEEESTCSVMDELEGLYIFPLTSIRKGTEQDIKAFKNNEAKKFKRLRNYL